jgi:hypothetical protein
MAGGFNAYAADESALEDMTPQYAVPQHGSYASPGLQEGDAYTDTFGWTPELRNSTTETPSAQRNGSIPRFDSRPPPEHDPDRYWANRGADDIGRHKSQETVDPTHDAVNPGVYAGEKRWADNPRSTPVAETRVTQRHSPSSYSFSRLFDQFNRTHAGDAPTGSARSFNGDHFSMADHRRTYEILGMAPATSRRNTYRMEPTPYDANIVDLPPDIEPDTPNARLRSVELPAVGRAWRL